MYDPNKAEETCHPRERPVKPSVTVDQFKEELAQRKDLSPAEKARRFAEDMPLDVILYK